RPVGETPRRVSGTSEISHCSVCSLHGSCSSNSTPRHREAGPQDESWGAFQLHATTARLPAGACHLIALAESGQSYWSHQVVQLSLQPHQVCSITRIALPKPVPKCWTAISKECSEGGTHNFLLNPCLPRIVGSPALLIPLANAENPQTYIR